MYNSLHHFERAELMKLYRKAYPKFSYRDMINHFNEQFEDGGKVQNTLQKPNIQRSETTQYYNNPQYNLTIPKNIEDAKKDIDRSFKSKVYKEAQILQEQRRLQNEELNRPQMFPYAHPEEHKKAVIENSRRQAEEKINEKYRPIDDEYIKEKAFEYGSYLLGPEELMGKGLVELVGNNIKNTIGKSLIKTSQVADAGIYNLRRNINKILTSKQKALQEVKKGNNWLREWYSNPEIQDRYKNFIAPNKSNVLYNEYIKPNNIIDLTNRRNYTASNKPHEWSRFAKQNMFELQYKNNNFVKPIENWVDNNDKKIIAKYSHIGDDAFVDIHHPEFNLLFGKYKRPETTIHEGIHKLTIGNDALKQTSRDFLQSAHQTESMIGKPLDKYDKYLVNPTEIHARIGELRYQYGLKPNQEVTENMVNKIVKDGLKGKTTVNKRWFELIEDKNKLRNIFNKAPVILPIGLGLNQLNDDFK